MNYSWNELSQLDAAGRRRIAMELANEKVGGLTDYDADPINAQVTAVLQREPTAAMLGLLKLHESVSRDYLTRLERKLYNPLLARSVRERAQQAADAVNAALKKTVVAINRIETSNKTGTKQSE